MNLKKAICVTVSELRCRATQLGVSISVLSVKMVLERLLEITQEAEELGEEENGRREMLTASQRVSMWQKTRGKFNFVWPIQISRMIVSSQEFFFLFS